MVQAVLVLDFSMIWFDLEAGWLRDCHALSCVFAVLYVSKSIYWSAGGPGSRL